MQVPSQYAALRFWRNTAAASLQAGQTLTLAPGTGTLGYEWDEDVDNGFRPAGLIDMSSTTDPAQVFTDYGNTTANNVVKTHHLTLYRAPSGALVFGAGTVQWAWGLDSFNPPRKPVDVNMQQATVNLFADMHAQPSTLDQRSGGESRVDRHHRAHLDDHEPGSGRELARRHARHNLRYRDRLGRRRRRRGRGLHRRWHDLAPRHRYEQLELSVDSPRQSEHRDPNARFGRQRERREPRAAVPR